MVDDLVVLDLDPGLQLVRLAEKVVLVQRVEVVDAVGRRLVVMGHPSSNGSFGMPEIASDGIQVMDVTADSTRMGPPPVSGNAKPVRACGLVRSAQAWVALRWCLRQKVSAPARPATLRASNGFFARPPLPDDFAARFALNVAKRLLPFHTAQPRMAFLRLKMLMEGCCSSYCPDLPLPLAGGTVSSGAGGGGGDTGFTGFTGLPSWPGPLPWLLLVSGLGGLTFFGLCVLTGFSGLARFSALTGLTGFAGFSAFGPWSREGGSTLSSCGVTTGSGFSTAIRPGCSRWSRRALTEAGLNGFWSWRASCAGATTEAALGTLAGGIAVFAW